MTIKEIENLTGMTRANIRYYEKEGLFSPDRSENGYRYYSKENLEFLRKIKLLRSLGLSIEEIRQLKGGEILLDTVLKERIDALEMQRKEEETCGRVCREICENHEDFQTIEPQKYLDSMTGTAVSGSKLTLPATDWIEPVRAPFRRYFARIFDLSLCHISIIMFLMLVFSIGAENMEQPMQFLVSYAALLLQLVIEPVFLTLFGTTPGKWVMGLSVTGKDGKRLTYLQGFHRTFKVIRYGMGFEIPVYSLYRYYKSYKAVTSGQYTEWDDSNEAYLQDANKIRPVCLAGEAAAVFLIIFVCVKCAVLPPNRGNITTAEFCENYNRQASYMGMDSGKILDDQGKWISEEEGVTVIDLTNGSGWPSFTITETDGAVTSVSFSFDTENPEVWPSSYRSEMQLIALSLAGADKNYGAFSGGLSQLTDEIAAHPFESFTYNDGITEMDCDVTYSGYYYDSSSEILLPNGNTVSYHISFELKLLK